MTIHLRSLPAFEHRFSESRLIANGRFEGYRPIESAGYTVAYQNFLADPYSTLPSNVARRSMRIPQGYYGVQQGTPSFHPFPRGHAGGNYNYSSYGPGSSQMHSGGPYGGFGFARNGYSGYSYNYQNPYQHLAHPHFGGGPSGGVNFGMNGQYMGGNMSAAPYPQGPYYAPQIGNYQPQNQTPFTPQPYYPFGNANPTPPGFPNSVLDAPPQQNINTGGSYAPVIFAHPGAYGAPYTGPSSAPPAYLNSPAYQQALRSAQASAREIEIARRRGVVLPDWRPTAYFSYRGQMVQVHADGGIGPRPVAPAGASTFYGASASPNNGPYPAATQGQYPDPWNRSSRHPRPAADSYTPYQGSNDPLVRFLALGAGPQGIASQTNANYGLLNGFHSFERNAWEREQLNAQNAWLQPFANAAGRNRHSVDLQNVGMNGSVRIAFMNPPGTPHTIVFTPNNLNLFSGDGTAAQTALRDLRQEGIIVRFAYGQADSYSGRPMASQMEVSFIRQGRYYVNNGGHRPVDFQIGPANNGVAVPDAAEGPDGEGVINSAIDMENAGLVDNFAG